MANLKALLEELDTINGRIEELHEQQSKVLRDLSALCPVKAGDIHTLSVLWPIGGRMHVDRVGCDVRNGEARWELRGRMLRKDGSIGQRGAWDVIPAPVAVEEDQS